MSFSLALFMNFGYVRCNPHISCPAPALYLPVRPSADVMEPFARQGVSLMKFEWKYFGHDQRYHLVVFRSLITWFWHEY